MPIRYFQALQALHRYTRNVLLAEYRLLQSTLDRRVDQELRK